MKENTRKNIYQRTCKDCGATFPGGPRAWYCPDCRHERQKERDREHKRNGAVRKLGSVDVCKRCGKHYVVEGGLQKHCLDCREEVNKEIDRAQGLEYYNRNAENINPKRNEKRRMKMKICVVCDKEFQADGTSRNTCSPVCRKEQKRRAQRRADIKRGKIKSTD